MILVFLMQVRHSQRCNSTPLCTWIICQTNGEVCFAHCNCMAGLGEACTHIGAILFYLEAATKIRNTSCTQPYLPVQEKKKRLYPCQNV